MKLVQSRLIYRINTGMYIYIPPSNGWMPLVSKSALRYLADMVGASNVSVNYDTAELDIQYEPTKN